MTLAEEHDAYIQYRIFCKTPPVKKVNIRQVIRSYYLQNNKFLYHCFVLYQCFDNVLP